MSMYTEAQEQQAAYQRLAEEHMERDLRRWAVDAAIRISGEGPNTNSLLNIAERLIAFVRGEPGARQ